MTTVSARQAPLAGQAGFSLPEVMVAMGLMLVVLGGVFTAMTNAIDAQETVKQVTTMNSNLRVSMDLVVRDLLQVGQGLPTGRRVSIPNGDGSERVVYPGSAPGIPNDGPCPGVTEFADLTSLPAVTVGPGVGPRVNGVCSDVITVLAVDSAFSQEGVAAITADGGTITIDDDVDIDNEDVDDDPDGLANNIRAGDLIMFTKGSSSAILQVTSVAAGNVLTFAAGDSLNLNQFDAADPVEMGGTINALRTTTPIDPLVTADDTDPGPDLIPGNADDPPGWGTGQTTASRVWMVTYYVDSLTDRNNPRLMRIVNNRAPTAVGMGVEALTLSYDLSDGVVNPTNLRMAAADLVANGPCDDPDTAAGEPCSENQIRKVNVVLAMRSDERSRHTSDFYHNTLFTQVSLRSMAFVDRYR
jgi:prepilin-type N-terminal cleavage/methylation domain-containing protein